MGMRSFSSALPQYLMTAMLTGAVHVTMCTPAGVSTLLFLDEDCGGLARGRHMQQHRPRIKARDPRKRGRRRRGRAASAVQAPG